MELLQILYSLEQLENHTQLKIEQKLFDHSNKDIYKQLTTCKVL